MLSPENILPRIQPNDSLTQGEVFSQSLVGNLCLAFGADSGAPLSPTQIQQLGLEPAALLQLSLDNLVARLTSLTGQAVSGIKFGLETDRPVFTSLKVGQGLESCLMLLPHVWDQLASDLSGELVMAVPGQDRILFTSSDHFEGQLAMRKLLDAAYEHAGANALSRELFVWRQGAWQVFSEQAAVTGEP